ncbi:MAG: hypothetical protein KDN22_33235 [Verrucomicrobiae bacterium]|nr:hypothetical protein [Verrucomicrobiae bacterium]
MNRHQLATLLSWSGEEGFPGRKRLQKVVFFLQQAGCDLQCHYTLHHFGPYSRDVADTCDEMVAAGLVEETGGPKKGSMLYAYKLKPEILKLVNDAPEPQVQQFCDLGKRLIGADLWHLELGSTILFFHRQSNDWESALKEACTFKKVPLEAAPSRDSLNFAKSLALAVAS